MMSATSDVLKDPIYQEAMMILGNRQAKDMSDKATSKADFELIPNATAEQLATFRQGREEARRLLAK